MTPSQDSIAISFRLHGKADGPGRPVMGSSFFDGGMATIMAARRAENPEHANEILSRAYKGVAGGIGSAWLEWSCEWASVVRARRIAEENKPK